MVTENQSQEWYGQGAGQKLIAAEKAEITDILSKICGYHLVFVGEPLLAPLVTNSLISHRILLHPLAKENLSAISALQGKDEALPLQTDSVDAVVLSHVLEQSMNPHEVLREAHRILIPEGQVVITGFNPFSLWGLWYHLKQWTHKAPARGKLLTAGRLRDWLILLNFQIVGGGPFYFRPPISHDGVDQKLTFLEKVGKHLWPFWGGAYTLVAIKRVIPITPLRARWRFENRLWQPVPNLPKPTTIAKCEKK